MKNLIVSLSAVLLLLTSASCHREPSWKIKGSVENADGTTLLLEASSNGRWYLLDSVKTDNKGRFSFEQPAATHPGIYRLTLGDKSAYFPIDSIETIEFQGTSENFGSNYSLAGSTNAENLSKANSIIASLGDSEAAKEESKRKLIEIILSNPDAITAYYIINSHTPDGAPVFSPSDKTDLRVIGAVANAYTEKRPNDPRTEYLKNLYLSSKTSNYTIDPSTATVEVEQVSYPDVELLDENGSSKKLSEIVANGPVLVSFTRYSGDYSQALNVELASLVKDLAFKGLQVYQIGFDDDEYEWRQSAKNLPWTTVYNSPKAGNAYLIKYNVGTLPTTFIINGEGDLVERVAGITELRKKVEASLR